MEMGWKMDTSAKSNPYFSFLNGYPETDSLVRLALEDFRDKSGLSAEVLERAQVRIFSGDGDTLKARLGFASFDGQAILKTGRLVELPSFDALGNITNFHYRLYPADDGRRYLHPKGEPARPYILPESWALKDKPHKPLWLTEGTKKCLKLIQHGRAAIGLMGVWNFRSAQGGQEAFLFDDLASFSWRGRTVYLAFDMDLWTNPGVRYALFELTLKLMARGAVIHYPKWTEKKGIDDYLVTREDPEEALRLLEDKAASFDKFISPDYRDEIIRALKLTHATFDNLTRESIVTTIAKKLNIRSKRLFLELKEEKVKEPAYTDQEKAEALELLKGPNLVERFLAVCHTRYLGRDKTLLLVKLATLTRHLDRGLSVVLSGTSSVGKSALIETVLRTCDPSAKENFSRISAQYLLYRNEDLSHKVLTFYELNGTNSAAEAMRTAMTEGEVSLGTVGKDAQGSLAATEIRKGTEGLVILSTFTGSRVNSELATRVLLQEIVHDEDLARKVYQSKARGEANCPDVFRPWEIADSLIEAKPVIIPYLARLADLFPTSEERFHRDFDKTVMLIKASAIFHQYQREGTEDGNLIATEEDYRLVYSLSDAFAQSLLSVSAPVLNMLLAAKDMGTLTRAELQGKIGISLATMKRYISQAVKGEYINVEGRGQGQTITVIDIPGKRSVLPSLENIFLHSGEPLTQNPGNVDLSGETLAHPPVSRSEPNEPTIESDGSENGSTAHTGSLPRARKWQGITRG
jgi:hypothetical protein